MGKVAYIHFASKLPRCSEEKAVTAVVVCADYEGYNVITKRVRTVDNVTNNTKWTNLLALQEVFNFLYDMQASMIKGGVTKVYLVTDSPVIYGYLTIKPSNEFVRSFLETLYRRHSFGGPKEIRLGVGVCKQCFRNSAKSRCDVSLIAETDEEVRDEIKVYCFPEDIQYIPITEFLKEPEIEGFNSGLKLEE